MPFQILSVKSQFPKKFEKLKSLNLKKKDKKKLYQTTGINKRYISSNKEDVISLSIKSAQKIITDQIKNQIGFLFFVSQTSPYKFPSASCILQDKLGLSKDIIAIDINMWW